MRRLTLALACLSVLVLAGCSGGFGADSTYTFNQKDAGNIAASDSLGAGLAQHTGVQTAFVADEN